MRGANKSLARELRGTVLEILGTAFSIGCQVDGRSPKDISDEVKEGSIDSEFSPPPFPFWLVYHSFLSANVMQFLMNRLLTPQDGL